MKVLVVDDELDICLAIQKLVMKAGHECAIALNGAEGMDVFESSRPDLVVLDVMMPEMNGFDVCSAMRSLDKSTPIIMLSAKGDIVDKSMGFSCGCDDYVVKPFDSVELMLRIEAGLRRASIAATGSSRQSTDGVIVACDGDIEVNFERGEVLVRGRNVNLTPKEFRIVAFLASHPGEAFSSQSIIEHVWGDDYAPSSTSIAVFVRKIRAKIEEKPSKPCYLQTVWHGGYRLGDA